MVQAKYLISSLCSSKYSGMTCKVEILPQERAKEYQVILTALGFCIPVSDVRVLFLLFLFFFIFLFVPFPTNSMFRGFTVVSWNLCLCKATKSDVVNLPDCFPNVHPVSQASKVSILSYLICISPSSSSHLTFPVLFHFINQCIL